MIESRKIITSWPYSTIRLAFSITISETWMCRADGSSNVELITSQFGPLTCRSMSVTSSGRSSIKQHDHVHFGMVGQHRSWPSSAAGSSCRPAAG